MKSNEANLIPRFAANTPLLILAKGVKKHFL